MIISAVDKAYFSHLSVYKRTYVGWSCEKWALLTAEITILSLFFLNMVIPFIFFKCFYHLSALYFLLQIHVNLWLQATALTVC